MMRACVDEFKRNDELQEPGRSIDSVANPGPFL